MTKHADASGSRYEMPPRSRNAQGEMRKVGIEIELGGLGLDQTLAIVRDHVGGEIVSESRTKGSVERTPLGKFKVEVDSTPLKERSYLRPLAAIGLDQDSSAAQVIEESVLAVAGEFVPLEVVSPPIALDQLALLDPLWAALREAGAEDTRSSLLHAFGLHLNPEPPDLEVNTILNSLRGFLLLEDWIMETSNIDISRLVAPYIRRFPEAYRRKILEPAYRPTWLEFVDDYLKDSPTRNRPLDLLPLIAHVGAPDLETRVEDWALVGSRPTFHYRLPNCELTQPGWTPAKDWNRWVAIERVAEDPAILRELSKAYLETSDLPLRMQSGGWVEEVRARLALDTDSSSQLSSA